MAPTWSATRCAGAARRAVALGIARLAGWRYVIVDGYGSVARAPGARVRRAVAADAARSRGAEHVRKSRQRALSPRACSPSRPAASGRARSSMSAGGAAGAAPDAGLPGAPRCGRGRMALAAERYIAELGPRAGLSRRPPGRDRRDRMSVRHVVIRGTRPGCRLSRLGRGRGAAARASKAGCRNRARWHCRGSIFRSATRRSRRSSGVPPGAARRARRCGGRRRRAATTLLRQRRPGERFSVLSTA